MKINKNALLTLLLFVLIITVGYFIVPIVLHISDPISIINSETEVTEEYLTSSLSISNRIFEPKKKETLEEALSPKELDEIFETANFYSITAEDYPWLFDDRAEFYRPGAIDDYTFFSECIALISTDEYELTYIFDPYVFYVLESVKRPSTNPTPSQIASAFEELSYDSSLSSTKLIAYLDYVTEVSDMDSYNGTSYLSNSLYYSMYINKEENSNAISSYNYTLSYSIYDCITLGEKTIQFDGTLFAVTYFVDQYGVILYYNPATLDYCGYTILDI